MLLQTVALDQTVNLYWYIFSSGSSLLENYCAGNLFLFTLAGGLKLKETVVKPVCFLFQPLTPGGGLLFYYSNLWLKYWGTFSFWSGQNFPHLWFSHWCLLVFVVDGVAILLQCCRTKWRRCNYCQFSACTPANVSFLWLRVFEKELDFSLGKIRESSSALQSSQSATCWRFCPPWMGVW